MQRQETYTREQISRLLKPKSVAIVGASDKPGALGGTVLSNLQRNRFDGALYPVNPKRDEIAGLPCCKSVGELPMGVDCAILAIPRPFVLDTMRQLADRQIGSIVIFSAGFAEGGEEGLAEQQEIGRIAQKHGIVVEGPNCLGCVNYVDGIPLTFVETTADAPTGDRKVAVVSQSGAMAAVLATMLRTRDIGVSYTISTGNEAASGVEDYVDWLVEDENTHAVAMIAEHFRRPQTFLAAARKLISAGKRVVLLHPGKSSAARESAATHTGAMAGDHGLMRAKVSRAGVIMAETLEELGDITELVVRSVPVAPGGVAVLGESGAFKALTLDLAEELDLPLATLTDDNAPDLRAALPDFVPVSNPLDLTAQGLSEPDLYTRTIRSLLGDDRVGAILAGIIQSDPVTCRIKFPPIMKALEGDAGNKPLVFAGLDEGADIPEQYIHDLRAAGIPWFPSTERALRALTRLIAAPEVTDGEPVEEPIALPEISAGSGVIPEYKAKQLLVPTGIPFPTGRFAASAAEAVAAANELGYPVAMKAQAAALGHKSDAGGVALNLGDAAAVEQAWQAMHDSVGRYDASIVLDGVLIEAMGKRGLEMIVGAKRDPEWGAVVLVGFGGVTAEILKDVTLVTPDMSKDEIIAALGALKQAPLLRGWRGSPALDVDALADFVLKVGRVVEGTPSIAEIDLNPVIVHPKGDGVVALDALILTNEDN